MTPRNGFACAIIKIADRLRAEEQGLKMKAHACDTSVLRKILEAIPQSNRPALGFLFGWKG
jgi:hypothetical protein